MPISSLVVTLSTDTSTLETALVALGSTQGVTLGPRIGHRIALVLETGSLAEGRETVEGHIAGITGVQHIDVIRIDFEDLDKDSWNDDDSF